MITAMWGAGDQKILNSLEIPVVLYTTEQIFVAQLFVYVFKRWIDKAAKKEETLDLGP